jgi:hypothetical protein
MIIAPPAIRHHAEDREDAGADHPPMIDTAAAMPRYPGVWLRSQNPNV